MASEIDICNLALARLGDEANVASIQPPEGSVQAEQCARFYPIARDTLQAQFPWGFCTVRDTLALLTQLPAFGWQYAYAQPDLCLRVLSVTDEQGRPVNYEAESDAAGLPVLYTNQREARVHYTRQVVDTERFPALFTDALAWQLAAMLAGPVLKGAQGVSASKQCLAMLNSVTLPLARQADAGQRSVQTPHTADWIAAR